MGKSLEQIQHEARESLRRSQERRSAPSPHLLPRTRTEVVITFLVATLVMALVLVAIAVVVAAFGSPQT